MQNLMVFEGHDVEVFELNGQVLFNPYHVAEILDIKNVRDNIARMNAKQVVKLTNSKVGKTDFRKNCLTQVRISSPKAACISWYSRVTSQTQKLSQTGSRTRFSRLSAKLVPTSAKTGQAQEGETAFRKHDGKEHQGSPA